MKKYKWIIVLINLVILLIVFNNSIFKKEEILTDGQLILMELAPVDPRSLMQGDYMRLRYDIFRDVNTDSISKRGFCVVRIDEDKIASRIRLQENTVPINDSELLIEYTVKPRQGINIGAESYFFQEGKGKVFEKAKYGGLRVDKQGNSLLIGLYDENRERIE